MHLALRIALALAGGFGASVVAAWLVLQQAALADYGFQHDLRLQFRLQTLRGEVESRIGYGLGLSEIEGIQSVLETVERNDPEVRAVEVFTPEGLTLYSSDPVLIGDKVEARWLAESVGLDIQNDIGQSLGRIVLNTTSHQGAIDLRSGLTKVFAAVSLAGILLALIFGGLIAALTQRRAAAVMQALRSGMGDGPAPQLAAETKRFITQTEARLDQLSRRLAGADRDEA